MSDHDFRKLLPTCAVVIAVIAVIVAMGWVTRHEVNVFVFYFIPVALAAWRINAMSSYAVGMLCAFVGFLVDRHSGSAVVSPMVTLWNVVMRLIAFIVIGYLVGRIQTLLTASRKEVKVLSGLLPILAKCKKIRSDKGYWHQLESYLYEHTEVRFSHGLCEHCYKDAMREAGTEEESAEQANTPFWSPLRGLLKVTEIVRSSIWNMA